MLRLLQVRHLPGRTNPVSPSPADEWQIIDIILNMQRISDFEFDDIVADIPVRSSLSADQSVRGGRHAEPAA